MAISQLDFANELRTLRPGLIQSARRLRRCGYDDAVDLVSQAVLLALHRVEEYDEDTGYNGLRLWLKGILQIVARSDYRHQARTVVTAPLSEAEHLPALKSSADCEFDNSLRGLPTFQRHLIADWVAGYSQDEIALRLRLHRNTIAVRLEEAFAALRMRFPDAEAMEHSYALFSDCSRRTIYRKPKAPWRPWQEQHPPEQSFRFRDDITLSKG